MHFSQLVRSIINISNLDSKFPSTKPFNYFYRVVYDFPCLISSSIIILFLLLDLFPSILPSITSRNNPSCPRSNPLPDVIHQPSWFLNPGEDLCICHSISPLDLFHHHIHISNASQEHSNHQSLLQ